MEGPGRVQPQAGCGWRTGRFRFWRADGQRSLHGVVSHLHSTVPEIEKYVEPQGEIGKFLAMRFKEYAEDGDFMGWSKEIWDMAPVGWLLDAEWAPSVLVPTPILTDNTTYSVDRSRHLMRYVTFIRRDPILKDFFRKLAARRGA